MNNALKNCVIFTKKCIFSYRCNWRREFYFLQFNPVIKCIFTNSCHRRRNCKRFQWLTKSECIYSNCINVKFDKDFIEDKSEISQRSTQFWKKKLPIEVTDDGIEIFSSNLQSEKALFLISTTVEGIAISLSKSQ